MVLKFFILLFLRFFFNIYLVTVVLDLLVSISWKRKEKIKNIGWSHSAIKKKTEFILKSKKYRWFCSIDPLLYFFYSIRYFGFLNDWKVFLNWNSVFEFLRNHPSTWFYSFLQSFILRKVHLVSAWIEARMTRTSPLIPKDIEHKLGLNPKGFRFRT